MLFHHKLPAGWVLLAVGMTSLLWAVSAGTTPPDEPPMEASSVLRVQLESMTSDVHGGDGDGSIAIWWLQLAMTVTNEGPDPVLVEQLKWTMPLGGEHLQGDGKIRPQTMDPGESATFHMSRYLPLAKLYVLREDKDDAVQRQLHTLSGEVFFAADGIQRYTPFSVAGRYQDCCDPGFTWPGND